MKNEKDFKKEWEQTKKQLQKIAGEASKLAKKGEEEVVRFSKRGKLYIDSTSLTLKKEHLYYQIGKEYSRLTDPSIVTPKLKQLLDELKKVDTDYAKLQRKIKSKGTAKRKTKKTAQKKSS